MLRIVLTVRREATSEGGLQLWNSHWLIEDGSDEGKCTFTEKNYRGALNILQSSYERMRRLCVILNADQGEMYFEGSLHATMEKHGLDYKPVFHLSGLAEKVLQYKR